MFMASFTFIQYFVKWFYYMIKSALKIYFSCSDTSLILALMKYWEHVLGALLYLLKEILDLITSFVFLTFQVLHSSIFLRSSGFFGTYIFIYQLDFRVFLILSFLICNIWYWTFETFLFFILFYGFLLPWYLFLNGLFFIFWILFSFFSIQISFQPSWQSLLFKCTFNSIPGNGNALNF